MKIEMGIGWMVDEERKGGVRSANPGEYAAEIVRLRTDNALLRAGVDLMRRDGFYEPTGGEVKDLRHALSQIGEAVQGSDEELGFEWVRRAKRIVRHTAEQFRQRG